MPNPVVVCVRRCSFLQMGALPRGDLSVPDSPWTFARGSEVQAVGVTLGREELHRHVAFPGRLASSRPHRDQLWPLCALDAFPVCSVPWAWGRSSGISGPF